MALNKATANILKRRKIKKLRWGVAGLGSYAVEKFLPALAQLQRSKLVSVYSGDLERAKSVAQKHFAESHFDNYDDFLQSDFDTLYIGSVNSDHHQQVIKAAEAGKNILCEKPLALTSQQALEMIKACENNNVLLALNYVYRFHPQIIKAKELIRSGLLGQIISISADYNIDLPPGENFRYKKELSGGGVLRDLGTHLIDLMRFIGGEINEISGYMDNVVYDTSVEDFVTAIVKFKNGSYGRFTASYNAKKGLNRLDIIGRKGSISIENLIGRKAPPSKLIFELDGEKKKAFRKRANRAIHMLRAIQKAFLKNTPPSATGIDGLINLQLIEELERKCL